MSWVRSFLDPRLLVRSLDMSVIDNIHKKDEQSMKYRPNMIQRLLLVTLLR